MLTVILTSYNRPTLVALALRSLKAQTSPAWRCLIMEDGSNKTTVDAILAEIEGDDRFELHKHRTTAAARKETARYSALINEALASLEEPSIVAYMCDNVEYAPGLVETVTTWFDAHPGSFSGYVVQSRDVWHVDGRDGREYWAPASQWGHWDILPPVRRIFDDSADGLLDHSQVFHRLPVTPRWDESPAVVSHGDGVFFNRLIAAHGPLRPITDEVLVTEHLLK